MKYYREFATCSNIECTNPVENNNTGLCASCSRALRKEAKEALKPKAKRKTIAKSSDKMVEALKEYSKLRKVFLEVNPKCAVYPDKAATTVHHSRGRATIALLLNTDYWVPASMEGHVWIETHPIEAKERGFSFNRLQKEHTI